MKAHAPTNPLLDEKALSQLIIFEENLMNNYLTLGTIKGLLTTYTVP
jgi:hypothetical protein